MAGKFECYKDKAGEFRFRLKASNGQNLLASEGYASKSSCMNGIESVKKNSAIAERFDVKQTPTGKYRFNLKSGNGQVIGTSQNYSSKSDCENGMKSVAKNAAGAAVDDQA